MPDTEQGGAAPPTAEEYARKITDAIHAIDLADRGFFYVRRFTVGILGEDVQSFEWDGSGYAPSGPDGPALDTIAEMLRDPDWGVGMLEDIANAVTGTGRSLDNPEEVRTWQRH